MTGAAKRLGLIINPIAGMGGKVGLKGTDGADILERAIRLGATPVAPQRAVDALRALRASFTSPLQVITCPQKMGEEAAKEAGFNPTVVGESIRSTTTAEDTKRAAKSLQQSNVDLLLLVGGDGTARDVCETIDQKVPCLGIPSGVKVYSAVFSTNPGAGGHVAACYLNGEATLVDAEVLDVDESDFRSDRISVRLYGYLRVPFHSSNVQSAKTTSPLGEDELSAQDAIAKFVEEELKDDWTYIVGPGSTTVALGRRLGFEKTMLGVDVIRGRSLIGKDLSEQDIIQLIDPGRTSIIVTPIGGQGFVFGRGNPQISAEVIRRVGKDNIMIVATKHKIHSLKAKRLLVDTGDSQLDKELAGYVKAIAGYREFSVLPVST
ncbi:MAG: ATP-NAD kinase family protein [Candidatus Bathyarchaeia archaeon]